MTITGMTLTSTRDLGLRTGTRSYAWRCGWKPKPGSAVGESAADMGVTASNSILPKVEDYHIG
jgi:hypothetical protein